MRDLDTNPRKNVVAKGIEVRIVLKSEGVPNDDGRRATGDTYTSSQIDGQRDEQSWSPVRQAVLFRTDTDNALAQHLLNACPARHETKQLYEFATSI